MSYSRSEELLKAAQKRIPLGAQTFSKTRIHFPCPAPRFLSHGVGGLVYDVDGNEYVDLMGSLGCNILGYCDPDVDAAIREQLNNGITFSLATPLELKLAERLFRLYPCAEMVRCGKTGTDATTAAVRLARYHTGRDRILFTGYHGWADWSIGATNPEGVPNAGAYSRKVAYGDVEAIKTQLEGRIPAAAVVVDPSQPLDTLADYLGELRDLCNYYQTLLIFDEVLTAFRLNIGGAQAHYKVVPDLACLGKAMANGMPLSAVVGRADILSKIAQPGVFFSGTYFGETLSLAAAIATIDKLEATNGCAHIDQVATVIADDADTQIAQNDLEDQVKVRNAGGLVRFEFADPFLKSVFTETMCRTGTLISATVAPCYAHDVNCVKRVRKSLVRTFRAIADARESSAARIPA